MRHNGVQYLLEGCRLMRVAQLKRYFVIPLLLNILLFSVFIWFSVHYYAEFNQWAISFLPDWLQWLSWLMWIIFAIAYFFLVSYLFTVVATFVASPFNSFLSEKVICHYQHQVVENEDVFWLAILKEIPRSLRREWQKLFYYLPRAILLFICFFIPVINFFVPIAWFLFNAWMFSLQYADYAVENQKQAFYITRQGLREELPGTLGFGIAISLITLLPILNLIIMPIAVAGASAMWLQQTSYGRLTKNSGKLDEKMTEDIAKES
jgi:CysZ protein